jgi:ELWxxDGT repeat protein
MFFTRWLRKLQSTCMSGPASRSRKTVTGRPSLRFRPELECLERRELLSAKLVADLANDPQSSLDPAALHSVTVNGTLFFAANDGVHGNELWKSDGTAAGTMLVKDINPGAIGSSPANLTNVNGTLFFTADDGIHGNELWKSDGTTAGTVLVKDVNPGAAASGPGSLTNVNGTLFFTADDGVHGKQLWKSDGTDTGTLLVKDIYTGNRTGYGYTPAELTNVNGTLFFAANDGVHGYELWKSDGTVAGTAMVKDINPGSDPRYSWSSPHYLTNVNGTLFFAATEFTHGTELWKSDGTDAGTTLVKDIRIGPGYGSSPEKLTDVNGTLFFTAYDGHLAGNQLWKSDGTTAGTVLVKEINPGSHPYLSNLTNVNGTVFFTNETVVDELWRSDGTAAGTSLVKAFSPNSSTSLPANLTNVKGALYFSRDDAVFHQELWKSDGTSAGTVVVKDINPGGQHGSGATPMAVVNSTLFFAANDGVHGTELWKSDGTAAGTVLVKDINPLTNSFLSSDPQDLTNVNGTLFFGARRVNTLEELWKSDGTAAGTVLVKDFGGGNYSFLSELTNVNGMLFFIQSGAPNGANGGLWESDGTTAGTVPILGPALVSGLTNVNGTLYFTAYDTLHGSSLWKSTTAGTVQAIAASSNSYPSNLKNVNGTLFYRGEEGQNGNELWKSDGTDSGTVLVKDINPGSSYGYPANLTNVNGTLFFTDSDGVHGNQLWKSDGTTAGTVMVNPGSGSTYPSNLTNVNGALFYTDNDGTHGNELWKSDGAAAGTVLVKDIYPGASSSYPGSLTNFNGTLFFAANDSVHGYELWKSDGTAAGTVLVKDINPASASSYPGGLTNVNGRLFFQAFDGNRFPLWLSDGTAAGTVPAEDSGGPLPTSPPTEMNGTLFFSASTPQYGNELWRLSQVANPASASTTAGTPATINVLANDYAAPAALPTLSITQPAHGSAVLNADNTVTYTPAAGFNNGVDTFTYTLQNSLGDTDTATVSVTVFLEVKPATIAADLQALVTAVGAAPPTTGDPSVFIHVGDPTHVKAFVAALKNLTVTPGAPVIDVVLDVGAGAYNLSAVSVPTRLRLVIDGPPGATFAASSTAALKLLSGTVDVHAGALFTSTGDAPAIEVQGGQLTVAGCTFTSTDEGPAILVKDGQLKVSDSTFTSGDTANVQVKGGQVTMLLCQITATGDAPAILVQGGQLTTRGSIIEGTPTGNKADISITGGLVDLGTVNDPGGNTIMVHGKGLLIRNSGSNDVWAFGDTFLQDGVAFIDNFRIEDAMDHSLDGPGGGTVYWFPDNVFVSVNKGKIQRGVDAVPAGGTVNVETGVHGQFSAGAKLLTIAFQDGSSMTQQIDDLDPTLRTLIVIGTLGNDSIHFEPGDDSGVRVTMNTLTRGTFLSTGRLIAIGVGGSDNIVVSKSIHLSAWLYGGSAGNNYLQGGGGNDVLIGSVGNDTLVAGSGRDLLDGGGGSDLLEGKSGSDILIGGPTVFDDAAGNIGSEAALNAIMAEWTSTHDYLTRVNNVVNGGGLNGTNTLSAGVTVFDDGGADVLQGGAGQDLYFAGLTDTVNHHHANETVITL